MLDPERESFRRQRRRLHEDYFLHLAAFDQKWPGEPLHGQHLMTHAVAAARVIRLAGRVMRCMPIDRLFTTSVSRGRLRVLRIRGTSKVAAFTPHHLRHPAEQEHGEQHPQKTGA